MSIRIGGGPPPGPPRMPTHQPVPMQALIELAQKLREAVPNGVFGAEAAVALAAAEGVPTSHVYAAAAIVGARAEQTSDTAFVVCAGGCQGFGALECIDALLELRRERLADGKPAFDVHAFGCLDSCNQGPVVRVHAPAGVALIPLADKAKLAAAAAQVLD